MDDGSVAAAIAAAQARATGNYRAWSGAAEQSPGVGAPMLLPDIPHDRAGPARGLGHVSGVEPQLHQVASHGPERPLMSAPGELVHGATPVYAGPAVADYRAFQDVPLTVGDRLAAMLRQPVNAPSRGDAAVVISPDMVPAPTASGRMSFFGKIQSLFKRRA